MNNMVPVVYDAEFTGLHQDTTLISIALIAYDSFFYAEFNDYDLFQVDDWIQTHVIDNLLLNDVDPFVYHSNDHASDHYSVIARGNSLTIAGELYTWLQSLSVINKNSKIQIISDCYAYDWMLFNNLICDHGEAIYIPDFVYYIPLDFSTLLFANDFDPDINREEMIGTESLDKLTNSKLFKSFGNKFKHNSLWDAAVVSLGLIELMRSNSLLDSNIDERRSALDRKLGLDRLFNHTIKFI